MSYRDIPQDDYQAGFEVAYRAIKGTATGLPGIPGQPGTPGNMTPFLMGVRRGLEQAGLKLR